MVLEGILSEIEEADLVARLDSCEAGGPHSYSGLVFMCVCVCVCVYVCVCVCVGGSACG